MAVPIVVLGCVGCFFGLVLAWASKKFHVYVDPRVEKVIAILAGANCGACGYPGCSAFAKAVVEGKASPTGCIPGGSTAAREIAEILGVTAGSQEPMMAVVHCKGGRKETKIRSYYEGIEDCHAMTLVGNGDKVCIEGCLGGGSCVKVCMFDAVKINDNGIAEVIPDKCTGCGQCVKACPRKIISLIPRLHKIYLACSNHDRGAKVKKYCSVGCTACTLCVKATPSGAIKMENNLPTLDYSANENFIAAAYKCPSKCFIDLVKVRPKANIEVKCTGCGQCITVCPADAISGEPGRRHIVDKEKCIGCGICLDKCMEHAIALWGGLGYTVIDKSKRQRT